VHTTLMRSRQGYRDCFGELVFVKNIVNSSHAISDITSRPFIHSSEILT
jgi:hypothetical protein